MLLLELDVRPAEASLLEGIVAARGREPGVVGWGDPTATLPPPEHPAPAPGGNGDHERSRSPEPQPRAAEDSQERADASTRPGPIRVLLVDDHAAVRQAFAVALDQEPGVDVVGEAGSGPAALEQVRRLRPDVVLMDINLPGMSGIEATRLLRAEFPQIEVIGLSMYESEELGAAMRKAGARAYVSKSASYDTLLAAIRATRESDPA
jgi:CheY-like chemotaxis protein